ncbi:MAG TPA: hypothetical protein VGT60_02940, partial [Candidatus Limnocylindria bacterium]|nr:hypothetical protein [Candidatus Limnocylindria bacterium]
MTAEQAPSRHRRTVDVALEARARRWSIDQPAGQATLIGSVAVPSSEPLPSEPADAPIRVGSGGLLRVAVLASEAPDLERVLRRAVLASGAEL